MRARECRWLRAARRRQPPGAYSARATRAATRRDRGRVRATLPPDSEEHPISLKLAGLKPGITYHFDIYAASSAGEMNWPGEFTAPESPPGACPDGCSTNEENTAETPPWYTELSNSESAQTLKEYEATQYAKEQEEQKAKETRYGYRAKV